MYELKQKLLDRSEERPGPLETSCLIWTGGRDGKGYGAMKWEGEQYTSYGL